MSDQIFGRDVVENAFHDIEQAFLSSASFSVNRELDVPMRQHVSFVGSGEKSRIRVSKGLCDFPVVVLEDYFFVLLSVCHELAHYLNRHNDHKDQSELDYKALEVWADFFGTRLFMFLVSFRTRTRQALEKCCEQLNQEAVLKAIGKSLSEIYRTIYAGCVSDHYPPAGERVHIVNAGVLSFFYRLFGGLEPKWTLYVLMTISREARLYQQIGSTEVDMAEHEILSTRIMEIQTSLQAQRRQITPGLNPLWEPLIGTGYGVSAEQVAKNREQILAEISGVEKLFHPTRIDHASAGSLTVSASLSLSASG